MGHHMPSIFSRPYDLSTKPLLISKYQLVHLYLYLYLVALVSPLVLMPQPALAGAAADNNASISMSSQIVYSPLRTADGPNAIPGTVLDYSLRVAGPSGSAPAATGFAIGTAVPKQMMLFVGDLEASGTGPVAFVETDSGLEFSFETLGSVTDALEFSNNGGQSFEYVPAPDTDGYDRNVTHIRIKPRGDLTPTTGRHSRFSVRYRMKVK